MVGKGSCGVGGAAVNGLPYYKAYPRDFLDGTVGMPLELKGAYRLVLDLIYMCGGELVDDPRFISGHLGCSVRAWNGYRKDLIARGKISVENEIISNFRADKEMIITRSFQDKQRVNASETRKNKGLTSAVAKPKPSHTEPDTDTEREEGKPSSCVRASQPDLSQQFEDFWAAYPHRNGQKKNRKGAVAAFSRAINAGASVAEIAQGVSAMHRAPDVRRGYARDPTTWLNQQGWTDEIPDQPDFTNGRAHDNRTQSNSRPARPGDGRGTVDAFAAVAARYTHTTQ